MKRATLDKHIQIANALMYYIYTHIETHIDLDELSSEYHISKFHLHRIFKETFGLNIYENIKHIRLQKAANLLLTNRNSTITDIALQCGYSSQSSFLHSFKIRFGMTPKAWRNGGYKAYSQNILKQSQNAMRSVAHFDTIKATIVKMPAIQSYYIRNRGYNETIRTTWQKIEAWRLTNEIQEYTHFALFHDNPAITPLSECQYIACILPQNVDPLPPSTLAQFQISEGIYAKFHLVGVLGDVLKFIHWVYHEWLPHSGYETTTKPSYARYYKNNFLSDDPFFELDYYVSIRI